MPDIIFITGCPTSGKSTISKLLQEKLQSPMFEFGWIPEFKNLKIDQAFQQEEEISPFPFRNTIIIISNLSCIQAPFKGLGMFELRMGVALKI